MTTALVPTAELANRGDYAHFHPHQLEQKTSDSGVFLFPTPKFHVANLDPMRRYRMSMRLERHSDYRFEYVKATDTWDENRSRRVDVEPVRKSRHELGVMSGAEWMVVGGAPRVIDFNIRVMTTVKYNVETSLVVSNRCKYTPVLMIEEVPATGSPPLEFQFPDANFVVVYKHYYAGMKVLKTELHQRNGTMNARSRPKRGKRALSKEADEPEVVTVAVKRRRQEPEPEPEPEDADDDVQVVKVVRVQNPVQIQKETKKMKHKAVGTYDDHDDDVILVEDDAEDVVIIPQDERPPQADKSTSPLASIRHMPMIEEDVRRYRLARDASMPIQPLSSPVYPQSKSPSPQPPIPAWLINKDVLSVAPDAGPIRVKLLNRSFYRAFQPHMLEQTQTKSGAKVFPAPSFRITGLEPHKEYSVFLRFDRQSDYRHAYCSAIDGWIAQTYTLVPTEHNNITEFGQPRSGARWMTDPKTSTTFHLVFDVTLGSDPSVRNFDICLSDRCMYEPVLVIRENDGVDGPVNEFRFPEAHFITVASNCSKKVATIKKELREEALRRKKAGQMDDEVVEGVRIVEEVIHTRRIVRRVKEEVDDPGYYSVATSSSQPSGEVGNHDEVVEHPEDSPPPSSEAVSEGVEASWQQQRQEQRLPVVFMEEVVFEPEADAASVKREVEDPGYPDSGAVAEDDEDVDVEGMDDDDEPLVIDPLDKDLEEPCQPEDVAAEQDVMVYAVKPAPPSAVGNINVKQEVGEAEVLIKQEVASPPSEAVEVEEEEDVDVEGAYEDDEPLIIEPFEKETDVARPPEDVVSEDVMVYAVKPAPPSAADKKKTSVENIEVKPEVDDDDGYSGDVVKPELKVVHVKREVEDPDYPDPIFAAFRSSSGAVEDEEEEEDVDVETMDGDDEPLIIEPFHQDLGAPCQPEDVVAPADDVIVYAVKPAPYLSAIVEVKQEVVTSDDFQQSGDSTASASEAVSEGVEASWQPKHREQRVPVVVMEDVVAEPDVTFVKREVEDPGYPDSGAVVVEEEEEDVDVEGMDDDDEPLVIEPFDKDLEGARQAEDVVSEDVMVYAVKPASPGKEKMSIGSIEVKQEPEDVAEPEVVVVKQEVEDVEEEEEDDVIDVETVDEDEEPLIIQPFAAEIGHAWLPEVRLPEPDERIYVHKPTSSHQSEAVDEEIDENDDPQHPLPDGDGERDGDRDR